MKKRISLKDIAEKAGVSTSLVSFVLNGKGKEHRIGEEISDQIIRIARELDYQPNMAAKSLRSGKSKTIGFVVTDISNPFFSGIARIVEDIAARIGYTVIFGSSDENVEKMEQVINVLMNKGVDGFVIVPCEGSEPLIKRLITDKISFVLLDRYFTKLNTNYVCLNNFQASYNAVQHLIDSGYKRIGMVAYDVDLMHMQERIRGYREAMADHGLENHISLNYIHYSDIKTEAQKTMKSLLDHKKVDALFFATNTISIACLHYVRNSRLKVPGELGLVGFDENDVFDFFYAPLTYVKQPIEALANKAMEVLVEQIEKETSLIQRIEIDSTLVVRESSRH